MLKMAHPTSMQTGPPQPDADIAQEHEHLVEFFQQAGPDYEVWSEAFNMHFGFWRRGINPFKREAMLEQMNREIGARLCIDDQKETLLYDLGCGLGATASSLGRQHERAKIIGVTVVPAQIEAGRVLIERSGLGERVALQLADFTHLPFAAESADAAYAVESISHTGDHGKLGFIQEASRVLKPGGRFVVADCFIRDEGRALAGLELRAYRAFCRNWVMSDIAHLDLFTSNLEAAGFADIRIEDVSLRIAPSVAHAPFVSGLFLLKSLLKGRGLSEQSVKNVKASLMAFPAWLLFRKRCSYCLISGTKL